MEKGARSIGPSCTEIDLDDGFGPAAGSRARGEHDERLEKQPAVVDWWPVSGQRTDEIKKQQIRYGRDAEPTQTEPSHTLL